MVRKYSSRPALGLRGFSNLPDFRKGILESSGYCVVDFPNA
jgi:hypothetical protein